MGFNMETVRRAHSLRVSQASLRLPRVRACGNGERKKL